MKSLSVFSILMLAFCLSSSAKQIDESRYVMINGIEQWITIRGNSDKPALLVLHGGPGSAMSPFGASMYSSWESDYIIVQWDQRGAGRTYLKNGPAELTPEFLKTNPLTLDLMAADGVALTEYLTKYLAKPKVILFGSSWGSVLGVRLASQRPDLYYAYIGHSQIVNPHADNPRSFDRVRQLAAAANDQESVAALDAVGRPPYQSARDMGKWIRVIKKYERIAATAPKFSANIAPEYDNQADEAANYAGDDYSFANYAGDATLGLKGMASEINFALNNTHFKIPVYLIQGEQDILTPMTSTRPYFDSIIAPRKEYVLLPTSAHGFNQLVFDAKRKFCDAIAATIKS